MPPVPVKKGVHRTQSAFCTFLGALASWREIYLPGANIRRDRSVRRRGPAPRRASEPVKTDIVGGEPDGLFAGRPSLIKKGWKAKEIPDNFVENNIFKSKKIYKKYLPRLEQIRSSPASGLSAAQSRLIPPSTHHRAFAGISRI